MPFPSAITSLPRRILSRQTLALDILRLVLCAVLFTHGSFRLMHGEAPVLGSILHDEKMPAPYLSAWLVCLAETGGALLLAFRLFTIPLCALLIWIYAVGIYLFHRHNGFFVVGPGEGGWEYSALLITCLFTIAWKNRRTPFA